MLDLSSFQSVEDSLKAPAITQPEPTDIVDLSGLAPVPEPTIGDKVVTAVSKVKEGVGSLYDKVTGQESPSQVNIMPTRAESDMVKRQGLAKAKHLENLNTDMSYYLDAFKLGDPDALKLDPGTVAIQSAKKQTSEQGLDTSFIDPLMWPLENAVATGALKGLASVYDSIKMNKSVRTFMERLKPNEAEEMTNTLKFMEEHGINPTDALVQGSKGSDLGQFIGGHNVFGVRDAFNASETLANDYFKMVLGVTDKIKANGVDIGDIKTWKDITKAQKEVKEGVDNLRKTYKDSEAVAYGEVSKLVKSLPDEYEVGAFHTDVIKQLADEGVPPEAVDVVRNIFNRFAKPYADETKELAALKKNRISLQTEAKSLSMKQNEALKAGDTLEANRLEQAIDDNAQALKDLAGKEQELKDVRYMNTEEIMSSIKLINRRLYKPGGAISLKDADELRGLQIAKSRMEEFLESKLPDGELKQKIRDAKDITIARTTLFGAKDMGGEKALLANILNQGDFTKIGKYLTGPEAKENIVFIRDTFGKDSEVYKTSLGHYLTDKLGMTPEGLTQLLDTKKVFGISDRVNLQQAAAKISTLDAQDFSLVRQVAGKDAALDLKSIQRLTQNFADLENAAEKYGRGITAGKLAYVEGDANIFGMAGRGLKLVKDAVMYHSAKTAEKIIYNQPKFRTLTGALTGETIYLANNEDKDLTIEGILGSLVGGGVGGYYGGRATRSLLESDINKITRYLKSGAEFGENMPKGLIDSLTRLGTQARQIEGEAMDIASETAQKADLRPVGAAAANMGNRVQQSLGLPPSNPNIIQDAGMAGKSWGDEAVETGVQISGETTPEMRAALNAKRQPAVDGYVEKPGIGIDMESKLVTALNKILKSGDIGRDGVMAIRAQNLKSMLKREGVSDIEIEARIGDLLKDPRAKINVDKALELAEKKKPNFENRTNENYPFDPYTYNKQGMYEPGSKDYKVKHMIGELSDVPVQEHFPNTRNSFGWGRQSTGRHELLDYEPAHMLHENQSDILQQADPDELKALANKMGMDFTQVKKAIIVDALNEALKAGHNRVVIPVTRSANNLMGTTGVSELYRKLKDIELPSIQAKLDKAGLKLDVQHLEGTTITGKNAKPTTVTSGELEEAISVNVDHTAYDGRLSGDYTKEQVSKLVNDEIEHLKDGKLYEYSTEFMQDIKKLYPSAPDIEKVGLAKYKKWLTKTENEVGKAEFYSQLKGSYNDTYVVANKEDLDFMFRQHKAIENLRTLPKELFEPEAIVITMSDKSAANPNVAKALEAKKLSESKPRVDWLNPDERVMSVIKKHSIPYSELTDKMYVHIDLTEANKAYNKTGVPGQDLTIGQRLNKYLSEENKLWGSVTKDTRKAMYPEVLDELLNNKTLKTMDPALYKNIEEEVAKGFIPVGRDYSTPTHLFSSIKNPNIYRSTLGAMQLHNKALWEDLHKPVSKIGDTKKFRYAMSTLAASLGIAGATKAEAGEVEPKGKTTEAQGNGIEDALAIASSKASILKDLPIKKVETYDKATEVFYRKKDAKGLAEYLNKIPDESYREWFRFMAGIPEGTKITEASIKAARK